MPDTPNISKEDAEILEILAREEFSRQNARVAAMIADQEQIALARALRQESRTFATNDSHRVYLFDDEVDHENVSRCVSKLMEWHRTDPNCAIELQINNFGGDMFAGFRLIDVIKDLRSKGHEFTTVCYGVAASMGAVILQAGDVRIAGKNAFILLHQGSARVDGSIGEIEDDNELIKKLQQKILDILAERSNMTARQITSKWNRKNWWLNADEALELGFVDEVR